MSDRNNMLQEIQNLIAKNTIVLIKELSEEDENKLKELITKITNERIVQNNHIIKMLNDTKKFYNI